MTPKPIDRTLADAWAMYAQLVIPAGTSALQIDRLQFAFYAGASYALDMLVAIGDDAVSEEAGIETLERLTQELERFAAQKGTRHV
jgi:hypothetical protein